jgi:hypothetical protein
MMTDQPSSPVQSRLGTTPVVVLAPGNFVSGGPELSHQLADALVRLGILARMVYTPLGKTFSVPEPYAKYAVEAMQFADIPDGSTVIIPEVFTGYLPRLKRFRTIIWWMSVDNYHKSNHWRFAIDNGMMPWAFHDVAKRPFPAHVTGHFTQSEYARNFLASNDVRNSDHLGDYLNTDYIDKLSTPVVSEGRRDIIIYNPQKGLEQTQKILSHLDASQAVPIQNMTRNQVIDLLMSAKIYIDFGNHPGKDRIPREAAALGCCVITNRRGSAANAIDIPIEDCYKIDDADADFADRAANLVKVIFADFSRHQAAFSSYRDEIAHEPKDFAQDVERIFAQLVAKAP